VYPQQIRYAIATIRDYHDVSRPQTGHDNNHAVLGNIVFDAVAAMTQGLG
jgi:hypothetical protein